MTVFTFTRRAVLFAAAAFATAACSQAGGETAPQTSGETNAYQARFVEKGIEYGAADAPVTLVEYASLTCGHCADFHETVMPSIKENYVKTGKVKFVFREFPTPPVQIALIGFVTARCAGEAEHMNVLDDFFANQNEIFTAAREGRFESELAALAARHGLSEEDLTACRGDLDIRRDIAASIEAGEADGVNSTPTLFLNGEKLGSQGSRTPEGLAALIDAALAEPSAESTETVITDETPASGDAATPADEQ